MNIRLVIISEIKKKGFWFTQNWEILWFLGNWNVYKKVDVWWNHWKNKLNPTDVGSFIMKNEGEVA